MALIDYPVALPCPRLSGNGFKGSATFDVSQFDYDVRHRPKECGSYYVTASFALKDNTEMTEWREFYYTTLSKGISIFNASWVVEGDTTSKEFRFADIYTASASGANTWIVNATFEMKTKIGDL